MDDAKVRALIQEIRRQANSSEFYNADRQLNAGLLCDQLEQAIWPALSVRDERPSPDRDSVHASDGYRPPLKKDSRRS
jgi:hypothetical protein